jgi:hypothetical protein
MDYLSSIASPASLMSFSRHNRRGAGESFEQDALSPRESSNRQDSRSFAGILDRMLAR